MKCLLSIAAGLIAARRDLGDRVLTTALFTDGQHPPLIIAIIGAALD